MQARELPASLSLAQKVGGIAPGTTLGIRKIRIENSSPSPRKNNKECFTTPSKF
jgi:hypothetical protein